VSFLEFTLPKEELKKNEPQSADLMKTYVVKAGDTVSGIAGLMYQDPANWRPIAEENNIDDPRKLVAGEVLAIPKIT
jgi:nucleoid-associated protein YgaU